MSTYLDSNGFFNSNKFCPESRTLHHREVLSPHCPVYEQLNSYYKDKSDCVIRIRRYLPALPEPNDETIEISDTPTAPLLPDKKASSASSLPPSREANHISDLVTDMGEFGRQQAIAAAQDRKSKTGFKDILIYTFVITVEHYSYRPAG
jgi:hypothetical protein